MSGTKKDAGTWQKARDMGRVVAKWDADGTTVTLEQRGASFVHYSENRWGGCLAATTEAEAVEYMESYLVRGAPRIDAEPCEACGTLAALRTLHIRKRHGPGFDAKLCDDCHDEAECEQMDTRDPRDD